MKILYKLFLLTIIPIFLLSSCLTNKKLTYLQYSGITENSDLPIRDLRLSVTPTEYKIMAYDNLYIKVVTPDPQWSAIFNSTSTGQGGSLNQESAALMGYTVDSSGNIEIPYVGKHNVSGKTLSEIKKELDLVFKNYLDDAAITVKLVNNYVSLIGEVNSPGRYPLTKERVNVFEALSMAGDMREFGNRRKIQLIRPSQFGPVVKEFSLADRNILRSEYYYIMPNDILYVPPMKGRTFSTNFSVFTTFLSAFTTSLAIIAIFNPSFFGN